MRLLLKLISDNSKQVSINSNYALSSAIYKLLKFGSPEFSTFLHETGYLANDKVYKLFTFAINYESTELYNGCLTLKSPKAFLNISSPMIDDFIKNIVIGTFTQQKIEIYSEYIQTKFRIDQAELIPAPTFYESMCFKLASPIVLSTYRMGRLVKEKYYFRYDDDINEINRVFEKNLINKYEAVYNKSYQGKGITLEWNNDYVQHAIQKKKRLSKKVSIMKEINNPIDIIGIFCPFALKGDIELMKIGYECGFGENNSMGFGMVM
ncbi:MAG: putative RAMP superfamily DNA repair protein [Ignavibacteria bacterium]|nr:MAG: putative RAMP superfamily DNA repair protein [Ignavibacteria bacterium]KAF0158108.1 MAG: putative RAMP superfamily DNA repair protein [Ignavibacteria bacterium]